jgi:hypothetical protein
MCIFYTHKDYVLLQEIYQHFGEMCHVHPKADHEEVDSRFFQNIDKFLSNYMA